MVRRMEGVCQDSGTACPKTGLARLCVCPGTGGHLPGVTKDLWGGLVRDESGR